MRYRIIKKSSYSKIDYYIEKRVGLMFFKMWVPLKIYEPNLDTSLLMTYPTFEDAHKELKRITCPEILEVVMEVG